jgi:CBS domain containing-hemolysin-like protein
VNAGAFFWMAIGGLLIVSLASLGTRVIYEIAWHELKDLCRRQNRRDLFDDIHDHHDQVALGMETLRIVGGTLLLVGIAGWLATGDDNWPATIMDWVFIGLTLLLVLLTMLVWIPGAVARIWTDEILVRGWRLFKSAAGCVAPLAVVTNGVDQALRRMTGAEKEPSEVEAFEDEVLAIVTEGLHDGHLEADARQMIESVMELDDQNVADIMTPRSEVNSFSVDLPMAEAIDFAIRCGRTRIPVYENDFDNVIGILYVKDLLSELLCENPDNRKSMRELLRRHWSVPRTRPLDELLKDFLRTRNHLAIVVDEFNNLAGIVTIEDVLEEIVGEIVDETDSEKVGEIHRLDDHKAEINGRAHLADINEQLGLDLPEPEDFDTIGGLVVDRLGRIPAVGDIVDCDFVKITVLAASKRKVEEVLLESSEGIALGETNVERAVRELPPNGNRDARDIRAKQ